ncbi:hypothetical protein HK098_007472 [Nowakowskiella sp. JEL0407]|nr:hypothetical protein HK098_007472 [Nowakowskiella sp. JEL0407]
MSVIWALVAKTLTIYIQMTNPQEVEVILYQFPKPTHKGFPSYSGPCSKLETYLRMTGIKYTSKTAFPASGPLNKVPYMSIDGELVPDSQICIWKLQKLQLPGFKNIDAKLTKREFAIAESVRVLLEETVYRQLVYERWTNPKNANATISAMLQSVPYLMQNLVFMMAARNNSNQLYAQGFGRFSREQQMQIGQSAIDSVSELLGDQKYMFGNEPCYLDACVYGHLAHVLYSGDLWPDVPISIYLKGKSNLVEYIERITALYFPELVVIKA